ncbi:MAG: NAD-dependent protein deacylase, partial [Lachnospiraceae bacterium]|nr:NAD-dependent protein deacylase [Lachnospiraceae bacterium]
MTDEEKKQVEKLIDYVKESSNIVFFGGAGVSTDSGIPDFRSKDGLYNQHDVEFDAYEPEYLLSHDCLYYNQKVFFEYYRQKLDTHDIKPNITHYTLAKMEKAGKLKSIVTQNIDGLHQKAGSVRVHEIHGTTARNYCATCHKQYPEDYIFASKDPIPRCSCGGFVRPDVTMYGESLPVQAVEDSIRDISSADMLIIAGTSLAVYPAASYIGYFRGKHLAVINRDRINVRLREQDI